MDITMFMIAVYCVIDDFLADKRLLQRRAQSTLRDGEVLTMKATGEFQAIETESHIFIRFYRCYIDWFPGLQKISHLPLPGRQRICGRSNKKHYVPSLNLVPRPVCKVMRLSKLTSEAFCFDRAPRSIVFDRLR
jgi:hypothetical protein